MITRTALAVLIILVSVSAFTMAVAVAPSMSWCAYPEPAGVAALEAEVDNRSAAIQRNSPGQPVDRLTLEMEVLSMCETEF